MTPIQTRSMHIMSMPQYTNTPVYIAALSCRHRP